MIEARDSRPATHASLGVAIPAAGFGRRMGGVRKPFLELLGEPILLHSMRPFLAHSQVVSIVVALAPDETKHPPSWLGGIDARVRLVQGGATRGESVWSALKALPDALDVVAVHDAARPLVTGEIIDRCLEAVRADMGAVAGWPAVDTLKQVGEGDRVTSTIPRSQVWHAQTPQMFPRTLLFRAYEEAMTVGITDTDDASLVERIGGGVLMVPGSPWNLKVTRPEDLSLAEHFLGRYGEELG